MYFWENPTNPIHIIETLRRREEEEEYKFSLEKRIECHQQFFIID
jgi:hypothetical protein